MAKKIDEKSKHERPQNKNLTPGGPGRPKGRKNFKTLFYEAIEKLAEQEGISAEEFEVKLVTQAIKKGYNGDVAFYRDLMDRIHGKAQQHVDHTSGGEPIKQNAIAFVDFTDDDPESK